MADHPLEVVARFDVCRRQYLGPDGDVMAPVPDFGRDRATVTALYRTMIETRTFDEKAVALQRTGRLGTYASSLGQEAVGVGLAAAMREDDVLLPSFREHGAQIWRGVTMAEIFLFWGGDERGSDFAGPRGDFPICVPVGDQYPHAAGAALALQRAGTGVAVAVGGDGSTSKGDFYEALNMIGVWNLPAIFVINNNQWAISVPRAEQTAAETIAQKAVAAGVACEQVDGCDVLAVHAAVKAALDRARSGGGGALIECVTYRLSDHTTADDASRYREDKEVSDAWGREPIKRLRGFLVAEHGWTKDEETALRAAARAKVEAAAESYLATRRWRPMRSSITSVRCRPPTRGATWPSRGRAMAELTMIEAIRTALAGRWRRMRTS